MRVRLAALVTTAVLVGFPALAGAVTIRDIIELSRAGLDAQIVVALIEADGSRFDLEPGQILELKAEGVADAVIIAMLRSGRVQQPQSLQSADQPRRLTDVDRWNAGQRDKRPSRRERRWSEYVSTSVPVFVPFVPLYGFHGHVIQRHIPAPALDPSQFSSFGTRFGMHGDRRNLSTCLSPGSCLPSPDSFNEPVYWGWGGKRRPDTWAQPAATDREK